jgi:hypothetical protein
MKIARDFLSRISPCLQAGKGDKTPSERFVDTKGRSYARTRQLKANDGWLGSVGKHFS